MSLRVPVETLGAVWGAMLAGLFVALSGQALCAESVKAMPAGPEFSVRGGVYTNNLRLELKANGSPVIRFTTDGSEPNARSSAYSAAIEISRCMVVRARVFDSNGASSETVSQSYVLLDGDLGGFSSHLPLVIVNSSRGEIENDARMLSGLHVLENRPERTRLPDRADFNGLATTRRRGYSSLRYPKNSFAVKLVDDRLEPKNASILGMPKESDWVLYGPYPDKTLLRDVLAYELSSAMGHWAPRTRFVEVFLFEERGKLSMEHYAGLYVFEEKVTRDKDRVRIAKLTPAEVTEPDITGGYIFKKDHFGRNERRRFGDDGPPFAVSVQRFDLPSGPGGFPADPDGFAAPGAGSRTGRTTVIREGRRGPRGVIVPRAVTNYAGGASREAVRLNDAELFSDEEGFRTKLQQNVFYYVDPEPDEMTAVQRAWLRDYVDRFEAALYGPNFKDPETGYRAFIDVASFIDFHLFSEVTKNVDAFRFSTFYHKDRGGLLKMGPVWDWNLSFGNAEGKEGYMPERWLWPQLDDQQYSWFRRLFEDPDFGQRYVDRWGELRGDVFATSNVLARIDALVAQIGDAQERNFSRWQILGREINPNYFVGQTYREEIDWMKRWTSNRLSWIEQQFLPAPRIERGDTLAFSTPVPGGEIHFTMDGTDPRASGGTVSKAAQRYQAPVSAAPGRRVFARVHKDGRWSPPALLP